MENHQPHPEPTTSPDPLEEKLRAAIRSREAEARKIREQRDNRARTHIKALIDELKHQATNAPGHAQMFLSGMLSGLAASVEILDGGTAEKSMELMVQRLSAAIGEAYLAGKLPAQPPGVALDEPKVDDSASAAPEVVHPEPNSQVNEPRTVDDSASVEATIARVRDFVAGAANTTSAGISDYDIGRHDLARAVLTMLDAPTEPQDVSRLIVDRPFCSLRPRPDLADLDRPKEQ